MADEEVHATFGEGPLEFRDRGPDGEEVTVTVGGPRPPGRDPRVSFRRPDPRRREGRDPRIGPPSVGPEIYEGL